jgi:hypothetical protein
MTPKTDHTSEASVSLGVRTDAGHPGLGDGDRHAKPRRKRLLELRGHRWTPAERAILISLVAIAMGSLFVTTYSLTLGDPIPRHNDDRRPVLLKVPSSRGSPASRR